MSCFNHHCDFFKVQGTNDSSILSKVSMVKLGYFDDAFLREFVDKDVRRSPSINRFATQRFLQFDLLIFPFSEVITFE